MGITKGLLRIELLMYSGSLVYFTIIVQNYSLKYIQKYEIIIFSMKMLTGVKARTTKKTKSECFLSQCNLQQTSIIKMKVKQIRL
jgi:hypothetical protein